MVTKYDVFADLYDKGIPCKINEIVKNLGQRKSEYESVRKLLKTLIKMKLVSKSHYGYQATVNSTNQHLFDMLKYCMNNDVNYNELFSKTVAKYLSKGLLKKSFTAADIGLHPKTFSKISSVLEKNGFLIVLSRKPFRAVVLYNSFLGDILIYYGYRPMVARKQKSEYFEEIKKELSKFRKLRARNNRRYRKILETFQIKFIHHSLSIEGNPITLGQTFRLLRDKIIPKNLRIESVMEVQNYQKAFLQMLQNVRDEVPLNKEMILTYHFLSMQHRPDIAGKIRDGPVVIRGNKDYKVADHKDIESLLEKLMEKYNNFIKGKKHSLEEVLDFAAYLHNEFQYIHPFFDGNSRTTRVIAFHFLLMSDIPVFDIPLGILEEYVFSTKGAKSRDDDKLNQALQKIIFYNLKTINGKLLE